MRIHRRWLASALIVPLVMVSAPIWSQAADGDPFSGADSMGYGPSGTLFLRGIWPEGFKQITGTGPYIFDNDPRMAAPVDAQGVYGPNGDFYHVTKRQIVRYPVSGNPETIIGREDAEGYTPDGSVTENTVITIIDDYGAAVTVADNGDVYFIQFAEEGDPATNVRYIRKVSNGVLSTIAGNSSDASPAWVEAQAIAVTGDGNTMFLLEDQSAIRKVVAGTISPVAGTSGVLGSDNAGGVATAATLCANEIHTGPDGSVYAAMNAFTSTNGDFCQPLIRRITPAGQISSVAGNGQRDAPIDDAEATDSPLGGVTDVTFDAAGLLVFSTNVRDLNEAGSPYEGWVYRIRGNGTLENLMAPDSPTTPPTDNYDHDDRPHDRRPRPRPPTTPTTPTTPPTTPTTPPTPPTTSYTAFAPGRLMETRSGLTTIDGEFNNMGIRTGGTVTELTVTGRHGIPADASAVVLNVAVTETAGPGFITVFPCGTDLPTAANLNYGTDTTIPNSVIAKVGTGGKVCIYTSNTTHIVVDANGYFPAGSSYASLVPGRLMETRSGLTTIDGEFNNMGIRTGGTVTELTVTGRHGIPADASAVVLNVAVTETAGPGFITVFPCGTDLPTAANLNYGTDTTIPNSVIAKVGTGGKVCIYTNNTTHIVVDANGYFPAGSSYASLVPGRLMETRSGLTTIDGEFNNMGIRTGGTVTELTVTGRHGIPTDASAVVLNVAVTETAGPGFITVFPCGTDLPTAANLNYGTDTTIPNSVIAKVGTGGKVCIYTNNTTHIVVDANGYFM